MIPIPYYIIISLGNELFGDEYTETDKEINNGIENQALQVNITDWKINHLYEYGKQAVIDRCR